jgi:hypothetical protein
MRTRKQIEEELRPYYLSEESISKVAYKIWEENGCLNGNDKYPDPAYDMMTIAEWDWWLARMVLETALEFDSGTVQIIEMLEMESPKK